MSRALGLLLGIPGFGRRGNVSYRLNDKFLTDRASGSVDNTQSEPGPGLREVVANDGDIVISGGMLSFTGQTTVTYGDLVLYNTLPFGRSDGLTLEMRVRRTSATGTVYFGFFNGLGFGAGDAVHCIQINGSGINLRTDPNTNGVGNAALNTWIDLKIVLQATGCNYYINGSAVGSGVAATTTPLYVGISGGELNVDVAYIRVSGGFGFGNLIITFDDARSDIYPAFEYAAARGVMGTVYVITDLTGTATYLTQTQLTAMDAAGWAMGNHTNGLTQLATLTQAQQITALSSAAITLDGWGLTRASKHVAYPNNSYNADTLAAMATTGMLTGRTVNATGAADPAVTDPYLIPVAMGTIITATTVLTVQNAIRAGVASGKWPILLLHQIEDAPGGEGAWSSANWQALIDWIVAAGVKTRTIVDYHNT